MVRSSNNPFPEKLFLRLSPVASMRFIIRAAMSTPAEPVPSDLYGMFVGQLDPDALHRFTNSIDLISKSMPAGLKRVHLAFRCNGGGVGEGIARCNLFRAVPVELVLYNIANVAYMV